MCLAILWGLRLKSLKGLYQFVVLYGTFLVLYGCSLIWGSIFKTTSILWNVLGSTY